MKTRYLELALRHGLRSFIGLHLLAAPLSAQTGVRVEHNVEVRDPGTRLFHVTSRYSGLAVSSLDLSLPMWTPGWYTVENYARNMLRLQFTNGRGQTLRAQMIAKSAWRVLVDTTRAVEVRFDYLAPTLGLNQAKVADDWAFFTGTQLFLEPLGHREWPATVTFVVPPQWRVLSSLAGTSDSLRFGARDYDELADATTQLGRFDARRFDLGGKPHWFIATPSGALTTSQLDTMADHAARLARVQARIFDGTLPYDRYLYHYFFLPSETATAGGLEHASSHVSIVGPLEGGSPARHDGLLAHELFHVWNVKRMRPAALWPYDYSRETYTPDLWLSEGFTNYYASLTLLRAGLEDRDAFFTHLTNAIATLESADARAYVSVADASMSTWLSYAAAQPFAMSFYAGGEVVAALLDLVILHASAGAMRLDDFMHLLWRESAGRQRGFTRGDIERALNTVARRDVTPLLRRMVEQPTTPPYDSVLAFAGYRLERVDRQLPLLGMVRRTVTDGQEILRITPGGVADRAGLRVGDIVQRVDGHPIAGAPFPTMIGRTVTFEIMRKGEAQTISVAVTGRPAPTFRIVELPNTTPAQRALREHWLRP